MLLGRMMARATFGLFAAALACGVLAVPACSGDPDGGGGASASSVVSSSTSSSSESSSSAGGGGPWSACDACLDMACASELAACDDGCFAIEGCVQSLCANLSAQGSMDEGPCQVKCQGEHPGSKALHLAVVDCAVNSTCASCLPYPTEYDACIQHETEGACAASFAACQDSADCLTYRDCVSICGTLQDCVLCASGASGQSGRKLYEAYHTCVGRECIVMGWAP